ncbi:MAG: hypothetical protein ACREXS_06500, partial [Gammaproteobacteria bacterium]
TTARCDTAPTLTLRRDASPASPVDARLSRAPRLRLRLSMSRRENGDLFDPALFDRDAVRGCWRKFAAGGHTLGADVEKLLQIELTQQVMRSGCPEFRRIYDLSEPSL